MFLQWPQWKPYKFLTRFSLSSLVKFAVQHVSELHALHSAYSSPAGDDVFLWKIVGKHCSAFTDPITSTIRHRICIKTLPNILKWSSEVECAERLKYYKTHKLEVWEVLFKEVTCTARDSVGSLAQTTEIFKVMLCRCVASNFAYLTSLHVFRVKR